MSSKFVSVRGLVTNAFLTEFALYEVLKRRHLNTIHYKHLLTEF